MDKKRKKLLVPFLLCGYNVIIVMFGLSLTIGMDGRVVVTNSLILNEPHKVVVYCTHLCNPSIFTLPSRGCSTATTYVQLLTIQLFPINS